MTTKTTPPNNQNDGLPPFVRSWPQLYGFVIVNLLLTIVVFYFLKQFFK